MVARDHRSLRLPAIDKDSGDRPQERHWHHECDHDPGYLVRRAVVGVGNQAEQGEDGEPVPKVADKLGQPQQEKLPVL